MRGLVTILAASALLVAVVPTAAQLHYELVMPLRFDNSIPPDGSTWHGLAPAGTFCTTVTQESFGDNGDGVVSACDNITLSGKNYHIDWAGPTYHLIGVTGPGDGYAEPEGSEPPANPTGEIWHWIYPDDIYCQESVIDDWEDNGDGVFNECDNVLIDGIWWHVVAIELNIEVTEKPDPVEQSTWSKIKSFFRNRF